MPYWVGAITAIFFPKLRHTMDKATRAMNHIDPDIAGFMER